MNSVRSWLRSLFGSSSEAEPAVERRSGGDRRKGQDRRAPGSTPPGAERRSGKDRRSGQDRRT
jgi:hypothetical protein